MGVIEDLEKKKAGLLKAADDIQKVIDKIKEGGESVEQLITSVLEKGYGAKFG